MAAVVADGSGRTRRLRRVRADEDRVGEWGGDRHWDRVTDSWPDRGNSGCGFGDYCSADGQNRGHDMECLHHHHRHSSGLHITGGVFLLDVADCGPSDCVLPRVCDLFFHGEVPAIKPGVVATPAASASIAFARTCRMTCGQAVANNVGWGLHVSQGEHYPPAMAPIIKNGSFPDATASGS